MKLTPKDSPALENIIRNKINLSKNAKFYYDRVLNEKYPIRSDIQIIDNEIVYFVEITHTASWETLSKLLLYQKILKKPTVLVLAAKVIPDSIYSAADEVDVRIIQLPHDISVVQTNVKPRGKITSDKAWRVITHLLRFGPCSIRSISQKENVSYAWAHNTVKSLISRGIINQKGNLIEIEDVKDLFNAVAWERPLRVLEFAEITTSFESAFELARTMTTASEIQKEKIAFGAYIAASLQFGYGIRSDLVYCYVPSKDAGVILTNEYRSDAQSKGIKLILLLADRDVFSDSDTLDGVKVTSQNQTLLDLAGLGYSGLDALNHAVNKIWNRLR